MANLGFVEAFAKFGARLINPMWAVSAIADDGALVMSCWSHQCKPSSKGILLYNDRLSRWGGNGQGCNLLKIHLAQTIAGDFPVRMIIATTSETEAVENGQDASKIKKTFHIREDVVGRVSMFDGDNYVIEFRCDS